MNDDAFKLTVYFGEHERVGHHLLSDALLDLYHRQQLELAVLLRGVEGFGRRHTLHTTRLLTLSEDLPLVSVAVDRRARIEQALPQVTEIVGKGLVTLERARLLLGELPPEVPVEAPHEATKLTVYCGRTDRSGRTATSLAVVELLRRRGVAGATVLLGVDGMRHGERQRAKFFSRNADVPLMIISVGSAATIAAVLPELASLLRRPLATLERVVVCKRDGVLMAEPPELPETDDAGLAVWQKLMIYASEQARHAGHPLYVQLVRRLREAGASGATVLRGVWGYSGDHQPHGDTLLSLRRRVPTVTVVVDRVDRMHTWWEIVDELTDEAGLVTSEMVPAFRAVGPEHDHGGLRLSRLHR
jgi:PII-like signaling protein